MSKLRIRVSNIRYWWVHALITLILLFALPLLLLIEDLHWVDMQLGTRFQSGPSQLDRRIVVIDIEQDLQNIPQFRESVGKTLHQIAESDKLPNAIGLDIWFSPDTKDANAIIKGIQDIEKRHASTLLAGTMMTHDPTQNAALPFTRLPDFNHMEVYQHLRLGHTQARHPLGIEDVWPFYQPCQSKEVPFLALALILAKGQEQSAADWCNQNADQRREPRLIPLGPKLLEEPNGQVFRVSLDDTQCKSRWHQYKADRNGTQELICLSQLPDLGAKTLIIGNFKNDTSAYYPGRPGPEIVAWAVSDLMEAGTIRQPVTSWVAHGVVALFTGLIAFIAYNVLLQRYPRLRQRLLSAAVLSGLIAWLIPIAVWAFARMLGYEYSQIFLPFLITVAFLAPAWHYYGQLYSSTHTKRAVEVNQYDVFISYRSTHLAWVQHELIPLLQDLKHESGKPITYFLDADGAIRNGRSWVTELANAIEKSTIFLAVLTPDYFPGKANGSEVCRWEMEQALDADVKDQKDVTLLFHKGYTHEEYAHEGLPHLKIKNGTFTHAYDWKIAFRQILTTKLSAHQTRLSETTSTASPI
jgi:hypothetical protein